ncbi:MAG: DMT family transporter [Chlamydiales bacterium]
MFKPYSIEPYNGFMWLGLLFAISACFLWGWIFVIPSFLSDFSGLEVVLGRYFVYGLISAILFFKGGLNKARQISKMIWIKALTFAFFSNIIYYLGIIIGLRFASPSLTILIASMSPVAVALYGNWYAREIVFTSMIFPVLCILSGLIIVNIAEIDWTFSSNSLEGYLLGFFAAVISLLAWSWYAVHNARFLKRNPHIDVTEWTSIIGIATLFWACLTTIFFAFIIEKEIDISRFIHFSQETMRFTIAALILGGICSWLPCYLWNRASLYLPVSLMGPFLIFESIFGILLVFSFESHLPSLLEVFGMSTMLGGIILSIIAFRKQLNKKA